MILLDRRKFVNAGALGLASLGLGPLLMGASRRRVPRLRPPFVREDFERHVDRWFHVGEDGDWQSMQLVEVREGPCSPNLEQFYVVFRGSENRAIPEGCYLVAPEGGDPFDLYLHATERDDQGYYYAATFALFRIWGTESCA